MASSNTRHVYLPLNSEGPTAPCQNERILYICFCYPIFCFGTSQNGCVCVGRMRGVPSSAPAQKPVWLPAGQFEGMLDKSGEVVGKQLHGIVMS